MYASILIAGEWTPVKVLKVYRGRKTARVAMGGQRLEVPTCLFFGEVPGPGHPLLRRTPPAGAA